MSTPERLAPPPQQRRSAGISVKSSARIGVRDRLHQLADLGFQIIVGDDQRADGGSLVAPAHRDCLIDRGLEPVVQPVIAYSAQF
jgi:hypothetical protein